MSKKELLHELFAANTEFLMSLKTIPEYESTDRINARTYLNMILQEVERRKNTELN